MFIVFGLVTPTRPPYPGTPSPLYIYNIYNPPTHAVTHWVVSGGVVEWGHETKIITCFPDPRENIRDGEEGKEKLENIVV